MVFGFGKSKAPTEDVAVATLLTVWQVDEADPPVAMLRDGIKRLSTSGADHFSEAFVLRLFGTVVAVRGALTATPEVRDRFLAWFHASNAILGGFESSVFEKDDPRLDGLRAQVFAGVSQFAATYPSEHFLIAQMRARAPRFDFIQDRWEMYIKAFDEGGEIGFVTGHVAGQLTDGFEAVGRAFAKRVGGSPERLVALPATLIATQQFQATQLGLKTYRLT